MEGLFRTPRFRISGDTGLLVEYGDCIAPEVNRKVRAVTVLLDKERLPGILEVVPTYRSVLILYDPAVLEISTLFILVEDLERRLDESVIPPPKTVIIPVCYGDEFGPDIEFVAQYSGINVSEVIRVHSGVAYQIYMIGFAPGFPFLGGLPEILHTPRLETPRDRVLPGSVGIANNQTGIYPVESPGGWRLIGRTPLRLFDPNSENPFLYESGDLIKFEPISREEYRDLI
ncbi:MAG: 5-oxoprolinase subunit PxpB [Thermodesulfobacteriota bacterium]